MITRGLWFSLGFSVLLSCLSMQAWAHDGEESEGSTLDLDRVGPPEHGVRPSSLLIRDVRVIRGNGRPATGPTDVLIEGNEIVRVGAFRGDQAPGAVLDGKGKSLIPGLINMHGHIQEDRGGVPMPLEYQMNLWLASGITTIRDVGSNFDRTLEIRDLSEKGEIPAPRVFVYAWVPPMDDATALRDKVRELHRKGADGLKVYSLDRDLVKAVMEEANRLGLPATTHIGVVEATAWDSIENGMTSIEHWYGIPDAALDGLQRFPPEYSYSNEVDRFRWAGRLWRETNPEKLEQVLGAMVEAGVAWDPTFAIYEASRDIVRAQNKPWFKDYLHPALESFFSPNLDSHGSYFIGWSNTDEVYWRENYQIWFDAVLKFSRMGGVVTTGEDAGFIYVMHGFGLIRELELQEEAGFTTLEVLKHATFNGAQVLGQGHRIGRIRNGYLADLALVDGNPLANLRVLYPTGADFYVDGKAVRGGGVVWTIKDGIPYRGETLRARVRELVLEGRSQGVGSDD